VAQDLESLPEYTCIETVQRFINSKPVDTIRLEILFTGKKELYASPGSRSFKDDDPSAFIASGMIGDGMLGTRLHNIFLSGATVFQWRGEEETGRDRGWARAVKYDFRISRLESQYTVSSRGWSGVVGMKGSFWADPETFELLRVEIHADEIPPMLPVRDVVTLSNYARMRIGERDVMLPQSSELQMYHLDGSLSLDIFDFTHCRSYHAESTIAFGVDPDLGSQSRTAAVPPSDEVSGTVPAGLTVPVELTTAVDDDATVGALLEGRVTRSIDLKGKTILPENAVVRARIRRLERYRDAGRYWIVGLEFTEVETSTGRLRFYADMESASGAPGLEWFAAGKNRPGPRGSVVTEHIRPVELRGVGSFIIRGDKLSIPRGFRMIWVTKRLAR
jgi:hypothetical protein